MNNPIHLRFQHNASLFPEKPAFIIYGKNSTWETVTYRQLAERSNLFARGLAAYGIRPGTRAVLMTPPSVDFFALVFALLQTGIVPVMVDPAIGLRNVTPCIAETKAQVYFGSTLTHGIASSRTSSSSHPPRWHWRGDGVTHQRRSSSSRSSRPVRRSAT